MFKFFSTNLNVFPLFSVTKYLNPVIRKQPIGNTLSRSLRYSLFISFFALTLNGCYSSGDASVDESRTASSIAATQELARVALFEDVDLETRLSAAFESWVSDYGLNGASVTVFSPDTYSWSTGSGVVLLDEDGAFESDTQVRVGSATKSMTATVILQLIEEGKLTLETTLSEYVDYPNGEAITVDHLIRHRSGIYDVTLDDFNYLLSAIENDEKWLTPEEVLYWTYGPELPIDSLSQDKLLPRGPAFAPGEGFHYSQPGFIALGLMIETIEGKPLADVFEERLFQPLGMANTYLAEKDQDHFPIGYTNVFGMLETLVPTTSVVTSLNSNNSSGWAAGGVVSTSEDLVKFLSGLFSGQLLTDASLLSMTDWVSGTARFGDIEYGMGLFRNQRDGFTTIGHGGSVPGSGSVMEYVEKYDLYITATRNTDMKDDLPEETEGLVERIRKALLDEAI